MTSLFRLVAVTFLIGLYSCTSNSNAVENTCQAKILSLAHKAATNPEADHQEGGLGHELSIFSFTDQNCRSERVIQAMIALLSSPHDDIREGAGDALANIGPVAKSAVPALERALRRSDAEIAEYLSNTQGGFLPTSYSGQSIRRALREITGRKIPEYNDE